MNRAEALEILKEMAFTAYGHRSDALDMAISALSDYDTMQKISLDLAFENDELIRENRTSKGEWIEVVTERFPNGEKRIWHYECSACSTGEPPCPINKEHWDFCPNCGADMRGE